MTSQIAVGHPQASLHLGKGTSQGAPSGRARGNVGPPSREHLIHVAIGRVILADESLDRRTLEERLRTDRWKNFLCVHPGKKTRPLPPVMKQPGYGLRVAGLDRTLQPQLELWSCWATRGSPQPR
jgi:hypothetical protein